MSDTSATPVASPATPTPAPAISTPTPPVGPATPTVPAASPAPVGSPSSTPVGEPPKERWDDILRHAREKTRREVEQEYRTKYGKYDQFEQDPWRAVQTWLDQAAEHSLYGPHIQQWAQRFGQPAHPSAEPQPDIPVMDGNGQILSYTYSATKLKEWHKWNQDQQAQATNSRFANLEHNLVVNKRLWKYVRVVIIFSDNCINRFLCSYSCGGLH